MLQAPRDHCSQIVQIKQVTRVDEPTVAYRKKRLDIEKVKGEIPFETSTILYTIDLEISG